MVGAQFKYVCFIIFKIFKLKGFRVSMFLTSSERNVERPKAQLKEHTVDKAFKLKQSQ